MGNDDDPSASKGAPSTSNAPQRLAQITSQVSNNANPSTAPRKRRAQRPKKDELPADYSDILGQLDSLRTIASTPDPSNKGYLKQKQAGKLWVRERVLQLLDEGSFHEVGSVAGEVKWKTLPNNKEEPVSYIPSNNVQGFGTLNGRRIVFTADDFSLRAGHADGALMEKTIYMEKLAIALRLPIIKLVDGSSGGGSVTTIKTMGYSYVPPMFSWRYVVDQLNMGIPNLGAVLGPAIGLGAARVVACHFSVMAADIGYLFNAGPKVVASELIASNISSTKWLIAHRCDVRRGSIIHRTRRSNHAL